MEAIKTVIFTIMLSMMTCFWVLLSAKGFMNYTEELSFLYVVFYLITILLFFRMWIVVGTRYLNINLKG